MGIIREKCRKNPDVQIIVSDGLSSKAIEANVANALPAIVEGLQSRGITVGTPFFLRFGRVAAMDHIAQALDAKVTCVLLGERPGLGDSREHERLSGLSGHSRNARGSTHSGIEYPSERHFRRGSGGLSL